MEEPKSRLNFNIFIQSPLLVTSLLCKGEAGELKIQRGKFSTFMRLEKIRTGFLLPFKLSMAVLQAGKRMEQTHILNSVGIPHRKY